MKGPTTTKSSTQPPPRPILLLDQILRPLRALDESTVHRNSSQDDLHELALYVLNQACAVIEEMEESSRRLLEEADKAMKEIQECLEESEGSHTID